jgi:hypothetical protein
VGIVNTPYIFDAADQEYRKYRVQVDGAKRIHFFQQQIKKKAKVIFSIKERTPGKQAREPPLLVFFLLKGNRSTLPSSDQADGISGTCQRIAYPVHPLVKGQVVGDCKIDLLQNLFVLNGLYRFTNCAQGISTPFDHAPETASG